MYILIIFIKLCLRFHIFTVLLAERAPGAGARYLKKNPPLDRVVVARGAGRIYNYSSYKSSTSGLKVQVSCLKAQLQVSKVQLQGSKFNFRVSKFNFRCLKFNFRVSKFNFSRFPYGSCWTIDSSGDRAPRSSIRLP